MYGNTALEDEAAASQGRLAYKWLAMLIVASASFFATVTMSIVNISLPSIAQSFGATIIAVQWVLVVYPLITVSIMLAMGYLGDAGGRKRVFAAGAMIFALGALLCGLSQNPWQLIASRVVQAVGGAMVMANSVAIVTAAFPARERGKSIGILSSIAAIGLSAGPTLGGILVDSVGWRWVFFVAVPLSALTAVLTVVLMREATPTARQRQPFDLAGAALLFVSMTALLLALSEGQENGWLSGRSVTLWLLFAGGMAALIGVERRAVMPLVDLKLVGQRPFATAAATGLLAYVGMFAAMFLMPFYLTRTAGYRPAEAGTLLTAIPLAMGVMSPFAGWLSDRLGSRWLCTGGLLCCTASLLLLAQLGQSASYWEAGGRLLLLGLGIGLFMTPNNSAMMNGVPPGRLGLASALVAKVRHLGAALGVGVAGAIFSDRLGAYGGQAGAAGGAFDAAASVGAFRDTYLVLAVLCALGVVLAAGRGESGEQQSG